MSNMDQNASASLAEPASGLAINPGNLFKGLRRWLLLILCVGLLFAGGAVYILSNIKPVYEANAAMLLGELGLSNQSNFDLIEAQAINNSIIEGELAIMGSNELLARVVRKLTLNEEPEYNSDLLPPEAPSLLSQLVVRFLPELTNGEDPTEEKPSISNAAILEASSANERSMGEIDGSVRALRSRLNIRQQGSSFVLSVTAQSESPRTAAASANMLMDEYIHFLSDKRFQAAQRFTNWLEERVAELAVKLETSEKETLAFRAQMESDADSSDRLDQQMREFTTKLVNARASLAEVEARAGKAREILDGDGPLSATSVLQSPTLTQLRTDLNALNRDEASSAATFGSESTQTAAIARARQKTLDDIALEVVQQIEQLENSSAILAVNVLALERTLRNFEGLNLAQSNQQIRLNQLQRIADANRKVYEEFLGRFKETSEIQNLQSTDAEVISYASPPTSPTYPRKKVVTVLAFVAGLSIGAALAMLLELRRYGSNYVARMLSASGLQVYSRFPERLINRKPMQLIRYLEKARSGPVGLAAKQLGQDVSLQMDTAQVIWVTAHAGGAEKSSVAVMLAWALSQKGQTCLLLDADISNATLSRALGADTSTNLLSTLYGDTAWTSDGVKQVAKNMFFLPTKKTGADPLAVFGGNKMDAVLNQLTQHYNTIVINAPSLEDPSDVFVPESRRDLGIFAISSPNDSREKVNTGLALFNRLPMRDKGLVIGASL